MAHISTLMPAEAWRSLPRVSIPLAVAGAWVVWVVSNWIYNLFFHPLRKIPGPKLAAMSSVPEFYYDVWNKGLYLGEIRKMHDVYGPIVRINPHEVHIADASYYHTIYTSGSRKVNKDVSTVAGFGVPKSVAATVDHFHHRSRRGFMNPYFSKRAIAATEPVVHERIGRMIGRLERAMREKVPISLDKLLSAMTADIILNRLYGQHYDYLGLEDLDFPIRTGFMGISSVFHLARFIPNVLRHLKDLPIPLLACILPGVASFLALQEDIKAKMTATLGDKLMTEEASKSVIFEALSDEKVPAEERTLKRLLDEGTVITIAGTETSSRSLAVGLFHLTKNQPLLARLRAELAAALPVDQSPDTWTLSQVESLPLLTGCVKESIRLAFGPVGRLPRVAQEESLQYNEYTIPPGYPVSQSTWFVHTDPEIYPDPLTYDPDRWIRAAAQGIQLDNYMCSFTKGRRQCLGINMAYAEIYLTIARVVTSVNMELYNTIEADLAIHHVQIIGVPKYDERKGNAQGEVEVKVVSKYVV